VALIAFLYVGLNWVTGTGRVLGLSTAPTPPRVLPTPNPVVIAPSPAPPPAEERTYVVREGDTPEKIARQYEVSVDALLRTNGITDPRTLQVGQTLKIPPPDAR
jgi:LysM repeat protein